MKQARDSQPRKVLCTVPTAQAEHEAPQLERGGDKSSIQKLDRRMWKLNAVVGNH